MEELKLLIEAVAGLPTITLWVLVGYLTYKLAVIGSMYGVIRFGISKFVEWKTMPREFKVGTQCINEDVERGLQVQIARLVSYSYIHGDAVGTLKQALDKALEKKA